MANYVAYYHGFYSGSWNANPAGLGGLYDGQPTDPNFTVGEAISNSYAPSTFAGTFVEGGNTYIAIRTDSDPNFYYIFSAVDPALATLPGAFTLPTLNTNPFPVCFTEGSLIATPEGEVAVETLSIGDMVLTADGARVPVKWIGRQTVLTRFGPAERLLPVRFAAGSLGGGLPHTDLTVTADHGMLLEGVICHAGALVNGTTITRVPLSEMGEGYTVYHVETEHHEIILANGASSETFIDNVSRRVFDNYAEFEALYGDVPEMQELPYPRAMSARQVPGHVSAVLRPVSAA